MAIKKLMQFSQNVINAFEGKEENYVQFRDLMMDSYHQVYEKYNKEQANDIFRNQFDAIMGIDFKEANARERRQAWRDHGKEVSSLVETILIDKMVSGWTDQNAFFENYVEQVNIGAGDKNEFVVEEASLLTVSKFAGSHHDIVRQALKPGKSFTIDTEWYAIKVYADFQMFMLGRIDFAKLIDRMYESIAAYRRDALYTAFMSLDASLPTDMIKQTAIASATHDAIIAHIELVKSVTGKDVVLVGSRVAIGQLQALVSYNMWSEDMKDEYNNKGILGNWEGYRCMALSRVNKVGTRTNLLDNTKIYILPIDPDFKPIKLVVSGDVEFHEDTDTWARKDRTVEGSIYYEEGVGVVVNQLFGEIKITS